MAPIVVRLASKRHNYKLNAAKPAQIKQMSLSDEKTGLNIVINEIMHNYPILKFNVISSFSFHK